jgi:bifunctional non-homologous end joining protein LigD
VTSHRGPLPRSAPGEAAARAERDIVLGGRFAVERHQTERPHFDLRLEMDGVVRSWAVPREPSPDPSVKRLAVHVEDHRAGTPSAHEFGAAATWDEGAWESDDDAGAAFRRGGLFLRMRGRRMRGTWGLVRMRGIAGGEGGRNWLLFRVPAAERRSGSAPRGAARKRGSPPPARGPGRRRAA